MKFIKLAFKSGLGTALAVALYSTIINALVFHSFSLALVIDQMAVVGTVFGLIYAGVHMRLTPTFKSSTIVGLAFVVGISLLSAWLGTFAGLSLQSLVAMLVAAVTFGTGALLGSKIGQRAAAPRQKGHPETHHVKLV